MTFLSEVLAESGGGIAQLALDCVAHVSHVKVVKEVESTNTKGEGENRIERQHGHTSGTELLDLVFHHVTRLLR